MKARRQNQTDSGDSEVAGPAPGKSTRTQHIQRRAAGDAGPDPQEAARHGTSGASERLPFMEVIQQSFGNHDVGGVEAHTDANAVEASTALGASAFASGNHVAFAGAPDLHTAAHEAAHVVQQRAGVHLKDGMGEVGDAYEQHADAVAARVVRGESAAELLDQMAPASAGTASHGPVQRFGTGEHRNLGDEGSAGLTTGYQWNTKAERESGKRAGKGEFRFVLTHGDLCCLSGDYFDPRDNDDKGKPIPDSLFRMATKSSPDVGKTVGTQDEVLYALKKHASEGGGDKRFSTVCTPEQPEGGEWSQIEFSQAVIDAVESRYLKLASRNDEHFQAPKGAGSGGPDSGNRASGGGSYRALHEDAILRAYRAKTDGKPVTDAMAHEAAAQHFLTDAFAAGHARTPRGSIRSHWSAKYPLFFSNLKKAIAHEAAIYINDNTTNTATILGSVQDIMGGILEKVEDKTKDLPPFGFDDVVSLVVHDIDNERGLWVTNDLNERWRTFGDGELDKGETKEKALKAVELGCKDIHSAHGLEQSLGDDAVLSEVKARTPAPATVQDKYGPEQVVPRLDPSMAGSNGKQNWEVDSFETLWTKPVRTDDPAETFETVIRASMTGGELHEKLGGMGAKFPESEEVYKKGVWLGTIHPQAAYMNGFFQPIVDDPYSGMRRIIHYNPARGQSFNNTDDAVMEDFERMDKADGAAGKPAHTSAAGLTLPQRISRTKELLAGWTADDEGDRIVEMFETASSADRLALYRAIEGHAWSGDFRHGWTTTDDDLWDDLTDGQLARLKRALNG